MTRNLPPEEKLIVALDVADEDEIKKLVSDLGSRLKWVKVGSLPFYTAGEKILPWLKDRGLKVFLDLKFHDIPTVVSSAISICSSRFSPNLLTVHASGGPRMFQKIREDLDRQSGPKPKVLGVTVLTSLQDVELKKMGLGSSAEELVSSLAKEAVSSGADGVVCSPLEVSKLRSLLGEDVLLVTPGIRLNTDEKTCASNEKDDQTRISTPERAIEDGASFIVMGRPILEAKDRRSRFEEVLDRMAKEKSV